MIVAPFTRNETGSGLGPGEFLAPSAIDLFSGAGGFSLGAHLAGFSVKAAVERDRAACRTYRENLIENGLTNCRLFERDIASLDPRELIEHLERSALGCDLLLGGPPCQGFSGHRLRDAGVSDPRNLLLRRYIDFVQALKPNFFLIENVPGLLWPRHAGFLEELLSSIEQAGYAHTVPTTLNARDYGVPQNRRRVFVLGWRQDLDITSLHWPANRTHHSPAQDIAPAWITASTAFERPHRQGDPNDLHMRHNKELQSAFALTPINGGSRFDAPRRLACHSTHNGHYDVYGRIDPRKPGPTMTTACINPSKGRFVHPTEPHGITIRQAARLQTFPEWFTFHGGLMASGVQIGNAVPVSLAAALLQPLADWLRANRQKQRSEAA